MKCTLDGCTFKRDGGLVKEEQLECMKSPKVKLCIELRANSNKKKTFCGICNKEGVAKVGGEAEPVCIHSSSVHEVVDAVGRRHV